jgi:hypothetical protein
MVFPGPVPYGARDTPFPGDNAVEYREVRERLSSNNISYKIRVYFRISLGNNSAIAVESQDKAHEPSKSKHRY